LRDVAGVDRDEECRGNPTDEWAVLFGEDERTTESDLDDTGCDDHKVLVEWLPIRHLGLKILAGKSEVADTREHKGSTEGDAANSASDAARAGGLFDRSGGSGGVSALWCLLHLLILVVRAAHLPRAAQSARRERSSDARGHTGRMTEATASSPARPSLLQHWNAKGITFAVLSLVGLVGTWFFNALAIVQMRNFFGDWFGSGPAVSSLGVDLLVVAVAGSILIIVEARRLGMKRAWLYIVLSGITAFAFTFPLFLAMRERKLVELGRR